MAFQSICVFCGSSNAAHPVYAQAAQELGQHLALAGIRLIYGGGEAGLMGIVANAALAAGGEVIGVIPQEQLEAATGHQHLTRLEVVASLRERKARMAELADAFIALPGGLNSLDELFEVWAWAQLGYQQKPLGLFEADGFYAKQVGFLNRLSAARADHPQQRGILQVRENSADLLSALSQVQGQIRANRVSRTLQ